VRERGKETLWLENFSWFSLSFRKIKNRNKSLYDFIVWKLFGMNYEQTKQRMERKERKKNVEGR
jgi:hypothetical protein